MGSGEKKRGIRLGVGLLMLTFLLFVSTVWVVFDELFAPLDTGGESVVIPDFEGMDLDAVQGAVWLEMETEYRYDANVPSGVVLSQSPAGGSVRKISSSSPTCKLKLIVSRGREMATLPKVTGMDVRVAESTLRAAGFAVKTEIKTGARPMGEVYDMSPRGGTDLPVGTTVTLYASAGSPSVTVTVSSVSCGKR